MTKKTEYEDLETHWLECACRDAEHDLRIGFDPNDGNLWIEVQLNPSWRPWWKRLWIAVNYLVGSRVQSRYGAYDTTLLRLKDYGKIRDLLSRSEEAYEKEGVKDNER